MVFHVSIFIFCLETTLQENSWMRTTSVAVVVIFFFESAILKVFDHSFVQSSFSTIMIGTLTKTFKDTLQLKILRTWINIGVKPLPRHLTYYCMFLFLSNKLNLILIEFFCYNLFAFLPFDILCILKFIQYLCAFFIRASKIFMRLNVAVCEGLQPQNVIFLFSLKHQYLLTVKTTTLIILSNFYMMRKGYCRHLEDKNFQLWLQLN